MTRKLLIVITASILVSACGTKGPLYIPEKAYPQPTTPSK